ncbi:hypothetical protein KJ765_06870 [Candidatus Micrarchaeota archaeon]|nr:hypothetical protein [Candidatus Micrarchaeota archaeon]
MYLNDNINSRSVGVSRLVFNPYYKPAYSSRTGALYNVHPYPTKINYESIIPFILAHTKPGDLVYDGFAGTCSTSLAAAACANPKPELIRGMGISSTEAVKWGKRRSISIDLGVLPTFIGKTILRNTNAQRLRTLLENQLTRIENKWNWIYDIKNEQGITEKFQFAYWSDIVICPKCEEEFAFIDTFINFKDGGFQNKGECTKCGAILVSDKIHRATEQVHDQLLKKQVTRVKRRPILVFGSKGGRNWSRRVNKDDLILVEKISKTKLPTWMKPFPMLSGSVRWGEMYRSGYHQDITHVHHFYTPRNLLAISVLFDAVKNSDKEIRDYFALLVSSYNAAHATLMTRFVFKHGNPKPINTSAQPGALYISSCPVEKNVFKGVRNKLITLTNAVEEVSKWKPDAQVYTKPSQNSGLMENTVDYIFTDPPFGNNLQYSELNFLSESWLDEFTDNTYETIVSSVQNKGIEIYGELLCSAFKENFRILKPGRYMTIVFHNTRKEVWNALRKAIIEAGFEIINSSILSKKQTSFKQTTTNGAVKKDPIILTQKPLNTQENPIPRNAPNTVSYLRTWLSQIDRNSPDERTFDYLFSRYLGKTLSSGEDISVNANDFRKLLASLAYQKKGKWYLKGE